jgi:hypothetical protein
VFVLRHRLPSFCIADGGRVVIALFCGSRHWTDREEIADTIAMLPDATIVVEGGAPGADKIAREEAIKRGLHTATVRAHWGRLGAAAGPARNAAMLLLKPDVVFAFPFDDSRGTWGMVQLARDAGIEVRVSSSMRTVQQPTESTEATNE